MFIFYPTLLQVSYQEIEATEGGHIPIHKSLGIIKPDEMLNVPAVVAQQKKLQVKPVFTDGATENPGLVFLFPVSIALPVPI